MAAYRWVDGLKVTCGLTACTPGSAPGPALGNEYGKTLPLPTVYAAVVAVRTSCVIARKKTAGKHWCRMPLRTDSPVIDICCISSY